MDNWLSRLAKSIQESADNYVPEWFMREINREDIFDRLGRGETVDIHGPNGITISIKASKIISYLPAPIPIRNLGSNDDIRL